MEYHKLFIDKEYVATFADIRDARSCVGHLKRDDQSYEIQTIGPSGERINWTTGRIAPDADIWRKYRKAYVAEVRFDGSVASLKADVVYNHPPGETGSVRAVGGGIVVSYSVLSYGDAVEIALGRIRYIITENALDSLKSIAKPE